jgi:hypothetical protein
MMAGENVTNYLYPLDITGSAVTNLVLNERQTLNPPPTPEENNGEISFHFIIPFAAPFYRDSVVLRHIASGQLLYRGIHYAVGHKFIDASKETEGRQGGIYASIMFFDPTLSGQVALEKYQTLGGTWTLNENKILEILSNRAADPRTLSFEEVAEKPDRFPALPHDHDINDVTGAKELIASNYDIAAAIRERTQDWLDNPPHLPGDMTPELIAAYNILIQQQFANYYTRGQTDGKLTDLDTTLRALIKDLQDGNSTVLDDYVTKVAGDQRYLLKNALDDYVTKTYFSDNTYSTREIDQMFADLNSDLAAVVSNTVNLVLNQYTVDSVSDTQITLADLQTIDNKVLGARTTVLAAGQVNAIENGLYVVDSGAWKRVDYPILDGLLVKVRAGGAKFGSTKWNLTTKGTITVGTTPLAFKRIGNMGDRDLFVSTALPTAAVGVVGDVWFQI